MGDNTKTAEQDQSSVNSVPAGQLQSLENPTHSDRIGRKAKDKDHLAATSASKGDLEGGEINNTEGEQILNYFRALKNGGRWCSKKMESPAPRITAGRPSGAMLTFRQMVNSRKNVGCDFQLQATKNTTHATVTHTENGRSVGHETNIYEDFTVTPLMRSVKS